MTASAATVSPAPASPPAAGSKPVGVVALGLVAAALAVAALSLLLPWALAFDPQMWLVWGRDVTHLELDTRAGPSWKPLPVLFTALFSLTGSGSAALWLIVARAGALLALAGAWTLARRIAGVPAAAAATAAMALGPWWLTNAALGNSEGILTAAALWAVIAHLSGRRSAAILLGLVAAALRPEVWPFLFVYGVWAWRADPGTRPALVFAAVAVPVLWFGPDVTGGGGALGASRAARGTPSEGSAALADVPLLAIVWDAVKIGGIPVTVCAALAAVDASPWRARRWTLTWILALGAVAWVLIVAAMTVGGFAGNPRYLVVAAAVFAVLAGVGAVRLVDAARLPVAAVALLPLSVGALAFAGLRDDMRDVGVRADRWDALPRLVAAAGGRDALVRCAPIRTAAVVRGLVAWRLDLPPFGINAKPVPPAVVLRMRPYDGGPVDPPLDTSGYRLLAREPGWEAWGACRG